MILLKITGFKPERILKKLTDINIYYIKTNKDYIIIKIREKDFKKIEKRKTIYKLEILSNNNIKYKIKKLNKIYISGILFSILVVIFFSNLILNINIITDDNNLKNKVLKELNNNGIKTYFFKKNNNEIETIEKKIKEKLKNNIEWINIENIGTKIIVKLQERKIKTKQEEIRPRNIIAAKNAVIKLIDCQNGEIIATKESYVKKGDLIISGIVGENKVAAKGEIYGEVWYKLKIDYPYFFEVDEKTNNKKYNIYISFLNKNITLFNNFKQSNIKEKLKIDLFPLTIKIVEENQIVKGNTFLTPTEAIIKAKEEGRKKILGQLNDNEYIIHEKQLKQNLNDSKIELEMFYTVYENITEYEQIKE